MEQQITHMHACVQHVLKAKAVAEKATRAKVEQQKAEAQDRTVVRGAEAAAGAAAAVVAAQIEATKKQREVLMDSALKGTL
jgi:hypothetical protein